MCREIQLGIENWWRSLFTKEILYLIVNTEFINHHKNWPTIVFWLVAFYQFASCCLLWLILELYYCWIHFHDIVRFVIITPRCNYINMSCNLIPSGWNQDFRTLRKQKGFLETILGCERSSIVTYTRTWCSINNPPSQN